jgi:hypothetical protein
MGRFGLIVFLDFSKGPTGDLGTIWLVDDRLAQFGVPSAWPLLLLARPAASLS